MEQLAIVEKRGANYILFELTGAINSYNIDELQSRVFEEIKSNNVVLDLSQISNIDSTGMGMIFAAFNDGLESGKKLYLMNMSFSAMNTVKETGFMDAFNVIQSVTEVQ
ncbi:MAG: STAS domain-containing protein [Treponema sp.]|nr:STAS domain-containing protein [Candidatus Treponema scatequi]